MQRRCWTSSSFHTRLWTYAHPDIGISQRAQFLLLLPLQAVPALFPSLLCLLLIKSGASTRLWLPSTVYPQLTNKFHRLDSSYPLCSLILSGSSSCAIFIPLFHSPSLFFFCVPQLQSEHFHHQFASLGFSYNLISFSNQISNAGSPFLLTPQAPYPWTGPLLRNSSTVWNPHLHLSDTSSHLQHHCKSSFSYQLRYADLIQPSVTPDH